MRKIKSIIILLIILRLSAAKDISIGAGFGFTVKSDHFTYFPSIAFQNTGKLVNSEYTLEFIGSELQNNSYHKIFSFFGLSYSALFKIDKFPLYIGPTLGLFIHSVHEAKGSMVTGYPDLNGYYIGNQYYEIKKDEFGFYYGGLQCRYTFGRNKFRIHVSDRILFGQDFQPDNSSFEKPKRNFGVINSIKIEAAYYMITEKKPKNETMSKF